MGGVSAMNSMSRVLEKHGDEIEKGWLNSAPKNVREKLTGVGLTNEVYSIAVWWQFGDGETLPGPRMGIDELADQYDDCEIGY